MDFEKAKDYRDLLFSVKNIAQKQKITDNKGEDRDVIALAASEEACIIQIFFVRDGKIIGREHFYMTNTVEDNRGQIIQSFVQQFYAGTPFIPKEIMVQEKMEDTEIIEKWLSERKGQKVKIVVPQKGKKEKLIELAAKNAEILLSQDLEKFKREVSKTTGALEELAKLLALNKLGRIEAYDISNISGYEAVGSMVVFENGKPKRSDYRKFRIKSVDGPNDYASMEEILNRRFEHGLRELNELRNQKMEGSDVEETEDINFGKFTRFPELIMMDGGKGQVNVATKVLEKLQLSIAVCGLVKDDNHRTRGLYFHNIETPIDKASEGFKLITRIQDEAHRFAIEYHRTLRSKGQVKSVLDNIAGVGKVRRKAIMKHFESIDDLRNATLEEIALIQGMNSRVAEDVYQYFHNSLG